MVELSARLVQWEKVKKAGMVPSPRTSFALATHKKRAILFGGVTDQHGKGDHMFSTLHDELYQFGFDSRRWYPVAIRAAKSAAKGSQAPGAAASSPYGKDPKLRPSTPAKSENSQEQAQLLKATM